MKHLKLFEDINKPKNKPKVGDYIVIEHSFLDTTKIYKIVKDFHYTKIYKMYKIREDNNIYTITEYKIVFFSSNIEDCETYLAANKYNL